MAKKKTEDKVVPEVIAKCDNLRSLKFNPSLPYAHKEKSTEELAEREAHAKEMQKYDIRPRSL